MVDTYQPKANLKKGLSDENDVYLGVVSFSRRDTVFFAAAFVFIYSQLFQFPFTPYYFEGDHIIVISNAMRMLGGEVIYRDFFHLAPPGSEVMYATLFYLFGIKVWVLNLVILFFSLAQVWLIWHFSRQFFTGLTVYLPSAIYLILGLRLFFIDGTYRLISVVLILTAVAVVMKGRSARNLIIAGIICGLSAFFLHPRGAMGIAGISLFLVWENYRSGFNLKALVKTGLYLALPFFLVIAISQSYFIYQAGFENYYFSLVTFIQLHYPNDPLAQRSAFLQDFPRFWQFYEIYTPGSAISRYLRIIVPILFFYLLIPVVYFVFLVVRWTKKTYLSCSMIDARLMLLCFVGLALFAGVSVLSVIRLSHISIPGIILLVWLLKRTPYFQHLAAACLILLTLIGASYVIQRQTIAKSYLDMPAGESAFLSDQIYDRYRWIGENTKPGDVFYEAHQPSFYFPFHLVNPTPMYVIRDSGYTPIFQVEAVVKALQKNPPELILWPRKWTKPLESRVAGDNLEVLWRYVAANYQFEVEFGKPLDYTEHSEGDIEIWRRRKQASTFEELR